MSAPPSTDVRFNYDRAVAAVATAREILEAVRSRSVLPWDLRADIETLLQMALLSVAENCVGEQVAALLENPEPPTPALIALFRADSEYM